MYIVILLPLIHLHDLAAHFWPILLTNNDPNLQSYSKYHCLATSISVCHVLVCFACCCSLRPTYYNSQWPWQPRPSILCSYICSLLLNMQRIMNQKLEKNLYISIIHGRIRIFQSHFLILLEIIIIHKLSSHYTLLKLSQTLYNESRQAVRKYAAGIHLIAKIDCFVSCWI